MTVPEAGALIESKLDGLVTATAARFGVSTFDDMQAFQAACVTEGRFFVVSHDEEGVTVLTACLDKDVDPLLKTNTVGYFVEEERGAYGVLASTPESFSEYIETSRLETIKALKEVQDILGTSIPLAD